MIIYGYDNVSYRNQCHLIISPPFVKLILKLQIIRNGKEMRVKMNIEKQIIFLPTNNLQETTHFYQTQLHLELFMDQGDCVIFKTSENGYIGFCERPVNIIEGKIMLTLIVDNVDNAYEVLTTNGKIHANPPTTNSKYRIHHFFITDPNGYLIEIQKFLDKVNW